PGTAILTAAILATAGWLYAARRGRVLGRKQHTFNVMLHAAFNKEFREAYNAVAPYMREKNLPKLRI
ncbi:MAG TPA: hypothetical protein VGL83_13935, partial [Stellaceae bacterium]